MRAHDPDPTRPNITKQTIQQATFDIINGLSSFVRHFQYTCVVALNQPSPEVFRLFDEVIVLKAGHIAYQGAPAEAKAHFESLGFRCPPAMDIADFLVAVTGKTANRRLLAGRSELAESGMTLVRVFVCRFCCG